MHTPTESDSRPTPAMAFDLYRLMRVRQWTKNVFVLAPLVFSEKVLSPPAILDAAIAVACFCLWSSAVYCLNDTLDARADRIHPRKRNRPVASGRVAPATAIAFAALLLATGVTLAALTLPASFLVAGGLYLVNSLVYCLGLKHRVIVDVLSIAIGFVLRLIAGCLAIGVPPSAWILVCGFSISLVLGFGKRRLELATVAQDREDFRPALQSYSQDKLDLLLGITASLCLMSYMLYTVSQETIQIHKTTGLIYTVPFVAYGVFRYLFKVHEGRHDDPVEVLYKDPVFAINAALWLMAVVAALYGSRLLGLVGFQLAN